MDVDSLSTESRDGRSAALCWVALSALWVFAAVVIGLASAGVVMPRRYQDEFFYWGLGHSVAAGEGVSWRGAAVPLVSPLYVYAITPLFQLADGVQSQFALVRAFNSVSIASVVFPVFVFARQIVTPRLALLAASFAVAVPAVNYAGVIGTESLAYPIAAAALLSSVQAIARPGRSRTIVFAVLTVLAVLVRIQFVALGGVAVLALAIGVLMQEPSGRRAYLAERRPLIVLLAVGALVALAYVLARGVMGAAGIYVNAVSGRAINWGDALYWLRAFSADLFVLAGVAPTIATFALCGGLRRLKNPLVTALVAVALAASIVFVLQMSWFSVTNSEDWRARGIFYERYMFYLGPIFFIGFVVAFGRVTVRAVGISTVVAVALLALMPAAIISPPLSVDAFGHAYIAFIVSSFEWTEPWVGPLLAGFALLVGIALLALAVTRPGEGEESSTVRIGRLLTVVLPLAVLLLTQAKAWSLHRLYAQDAMAAFAQPRGWATDASAEPTAILVGGSSAKEVIYQTEFWNPSVDRVYTSAEPPISSQPYFAPQCVFLFDRHGWILPMAWPGCERPPRAWIVSGPTLSMRLRDAGDVVAPRRNTRGQTLQIARGAPQVLAIVGGRDSTSGEVEGVLTVRTFAQTPARLRIRLTDASGRKKAIERAVPADDSVTTLKLSQAGGRKSVVSSIILLEPGRADRELV